MFESMKYTIRSEDQAVTQGPVPLAQKTKCAFSEEYVFHRIRNFIFFLVMYSIEVARG